MRNFRGELFKKTSEMAADEGAKSLPNQLAGACWNFKHLACLSARLVARFTPDANTNIWLIYSLASKDMLEHRY